MKKLTKPRIAGFTILGAAIAGALYGLAKKKPAGTVSAGMRVGPSKALVGGTVTIG